MIRDAFVKRYSSDTSDILQVLCCTKQAPVAGSLGGR
jgi:hypothetical protein